MTATASDSPKPEVKVGLEIHQQLASSRKLFCECPIVKSEEFPYSFERLLRPAQSETGRLDPAAVFEFVRAGPTVYLCNPESSCLVEADEEPPHGLSEEAVDIAIEVSNLLHSKVVDEIHVMRKIVIDGSNTTGFQRTAVVGLGGYLEFGGKKVGVQSLTVEEDAARLMGEDGRSRRYALDRLGVPLVEVALEPFIGSPEEVGQLALHLGRTLRSTGRVARGLGTIRQDLNVSVNGGKVVEVKGVQKLNLLPKVVAYETKRQLALLEVAKKVKERGASSVTTDACEVTMTLKESGSKVIRRELADSGVVTCIRAMGLAGLIGWEPWPGVRLGKEVAEVARANSLGGVIHSDEFAHQGISEKEEEALRKECGADRDDALVLLAGPRDIVERALPQVQARLAKAAEGVPDETRAATEEGETRYMRPRPGAQRMYPETDIPDVVIAEGRLKKIGSRSTEPWEVLVEKYGRRYSLSRDMTLKLFDSEYWGSFGSLAKELKLEPSLIASTLVDLPVRLSREGIPEESLRSELFVDVLRAIGAGRIAKEAAPDVLRAVGQGSVRNVTDAIGLLGLGTVGIEELGSIIDEALSAEGGLVMEKREEAFAPLMGRVMAQVRGRADGGLVSRMVKEKLAHALRNAGKGKQG
ncbi:MAG: Glu-tRNA(Gln) amidotransferase subunit GatE [Thaumarchaeota archaeon]|nr:Glu-tRNA(Gln) amidotransferase subunit GatE [Nitrososphaerota archaeon]